MNTALQNNGRQFLIYLMLLSALGAVIWKTVTLQVLEKSFLINQGDARIEDTRELVATRGVITDRNGKTLAMSTPLITLTAEPRKLDVDTLPLISKLTDVPLSTLEKRYQRSSAYMLIRRHMVPQEAEKILALRSENKGLRGLRSEAEYRRYYPAGEVTSQVVGLTNVDEQGQEGLELSFDSYLSGRNGKKSVLTDVYGQIIRDVELTAPAKNGTDLVLSIDLDLQYMAYRELLAAVIRHKARSGSLVILDVKTGDILAMVNQPSFNPNNRSELSPGSMRNRAVTDAIEPGSVIKALTLSAALETGKFTVDQMFNTSPGWRRINGYTIRDTHDYGVLSFEKVLIKSSNIGASEIALKVGPQNMFKTFHDFGLGQSTGIGFPGEANGVLPNRVNWKDIELATLSYGYGLTVTPLQLAVAYAAIANHGKRVTPHIVLNDAKVQSTQIISEKTAHLMTQMMEQVIENGTGKKARSDLYRIAGKTGTAHKVGKHGYDDNRYAASFAGFAPVSNPRLAMIVSLDDVVGDEYYGGEVSAPVFGAVMEQALRHLGVKPDKQNSDVKDYIAKDIFSSGGNQ
ncbi:peptidoglycan D,D-transpeptidase FtsI family protein [Gynuella sunshinyii]|uniref:Peptidoglycan D,D-transpeptidase FtsI n=1 Tax=Gynuella sunshinyii YC6258 TaxID=1445510 RepID=A0A0C5V4K9_9GAMM|nr:penicillin-binding protein 2 [Gynuella sunshinyii]AJQ94425.1 cell division protein FtsI/penicillin-binding protein 2 [Gynuella sunshinyii YC6258]